MSYIVEKGIPQPKHYENRQKYPLWQMEVGDSFSVSAEEKNRITSAACYYGKRNGKKFSILMVGDSFRCWRVK